jgi:hypothetical protein
MAEVTIEASTFMKSFKHSLFKTTFSALAGSLLAVASSSAATVAAPSSGDLFLAFRSTGSSSSYLVNLGQASQFSGLAPGTSVTVNSGNLAADLVATYGSWSTSTGVLWSIVGATDSVNPTLYATKERTDPTVATTPYAALDQSDRAATKTEIFSVVYNGYAVGPSTANNLLGTIQANASQPYSYNFQVTNKATDFGDRSQWANVEGNFGPDGAAASVLDLYRFRSASPTSELLGSFSISQDGVLTFTSIPEPSLTLLGTAGALLLLSRRSRKATI